MPQIVMYVMIYCGGVCGAENGVWAFEFEGNGMRSMRHNSHAIMLRKCHCDGIPKRTTRSTICSNYLHIICVGE